MKRPHASVLQLQAVGDGARRKSSTRCSSYCCSREGNRKGIHGGVESFDWEGKVTPTPCPEHYHWSPAFLTLPGGLVNAASAAKPNKYTQSGEKRGLSFKAAEWKEQTKCWLYGCGPVSFHYQFSDVEQRLCLIRLGQLHCHCTSSQATENRENKHNLLYN